MLMRSGVYILRWSTGCLSPGQRNLAALSGNRLPGVAARVVAVRQKVNLEDQRLLTEADLVVDDGKGRSAECKFQVLASMDQSPDGSEMRLVTDQLRLIPDVDALHNAPSLDWAELLGVPSVGTDGWRVVLAESERSPRTKAVVNLGKAGRSAVLVKGNNVLAYLVYSTDLMEHERTM